MSISSQIERLTNSREAIKNAITQKGVSVPNEAKISEMAEYIASIQQDEGGGGYNIVATNNGDGTQTWEIGDSSGSDGQASDYLKGLIERTLTEIEIPSEITKIGYNAFRRCTNLTRVTIPNSVTSLGNYAFGECTGLTSVTIPDSVTSIDAQVFYGCTGLTSITIPDSVAYLGIYVFCGCTGLTSVTIGNGVTSINSSTFRNCNRLTSVTISNSVIRLGDYAFNNCSNLTTLVLNRTDSITTLSYTNALQGTSSDLKIYVPDSLVDSYKSATNWSTYAEQIYPLSQLPAETEV